MKAVCTRRQRLSVDFHVLADGDRGCLVGACPPDFVIRYQTTPDNTSLDARATVCDGYVRQTDGLHYSCFLAWPRQLQLLSNRKRGQQ